MGAHAASVSWTGSFGEGMKILDSVTGFITRNKKRSFEELSDWMLAVLGVVAFLVAGYWGLMLSEAVPGFIKETNQTGISLPAVGLGLLLGGFGLSVWFFGCIAARCHTLLYERWFKCSLLTKPLNSFPSVAGRSCLAPFMASDLRPRKSDSFVYYFSSQSVHSDFRTIAG